ncbi:hypothetical protein Tco_0390716 [Tanacetum coccineum]
MISKEDSGKVVKPIKPDDICLPIRRTSGRESEPLWFYYGFHIEEDTISDSTLSELDEPSNNKEAMASLEAAKWKEAMKSEIQSMYDNQVWNLVDTTPGLMTVGCKWMFKKKTNMDGKVLTYKARLMDVKSSFLNRKLIEDVFMAQPKGFENATYPKRLGKCFAMKYLRDASYILGIKIYRDRLKRLIRLSQDTYLDKILKRFKIENSKKGNLPLHHGIKISKDLCLKTNEELDIMSRVPYALALGSIMYDMTCTRPDVSFALSMDMVQSSAVVLDGTLCLVNQDRLRPIIVDDLSK